MTRQMSFNKIPRTRLTARGYDYTQESRSADEWMNVWMPELTIESRIVSFATWSPNENIACE